MISPSEARAARALNRGAPGNLVLKNATQKKHTIFPGRETEGLRREFNPGCLAHGWREPKGGGFARPRPEALLPAMPRIRPPRRDHTAQPRLSVHQPDKKQKKKMSGRRYPRVASPAGVPPAPVLTFGTRRRFGFPRPLGAVAAGPSRAEQRRQTTPHQQELRRPASTPPLACFLPGQPATPRPHGRVARKESRRRVLGPPFPSPGHPQDPTDGMKFWHSHKRSRLPPWITNGADLRRGVSSASTTSPRRGAFGYDSVWVPEASKLPFRLLRRGPDAIPTCATLPCSGTQSASARGRAPAVVTSRSTANPPNIIAALRFLRRACLLFLSRPHLLTVTSSFYPLHRPRLPVGPPERPPPSCFRVEGPPPRPASPESLRPKPNRPRA